MKPLLSALTKRHPTGDLDLVPFTPRLLLPHHKLLHTHVPWISLVPLYCPSFSTPSEDYVLCTAKTTGDERVERPLGKGGGNRGARAGVCLAV